MGLYLQIIQFPLSWSKLAETKFVTWETIWKRIVWLPEKTRAEHFSFSFFNRFRVKWWQTNRSETRLRQLSDRQTRNGIIVQRAFTARCMQTLSIVSDATPMIWWAFATFLCSYRRGAALCRLLIFTWMAFQSGSIYHACYKRTSLRLTIDVYNVLKFFHGRRISII